MDKIIVSTGDIKQDYEVLRPIHLFHLSGLSEQRFGSDKLSFDQTFDKMIEWLIEEAKEEKGDAIIFLRFEYQRIQLQFTEYFIYGTLVKFK